MNRVILSGFILHRLPLFIIPLLFVTCHVRNRTQTQEAYQVMPEIRALDMCGDSVYCNSGPNPRKKTAVLFFSPDCEACRKEISEIVVHTELRNIQWIFITIAQYEELSSFINQYPILSLPDAHLFREDFPVNHMLFDVSAPPALFVFDEDRRLIAEYRGEVPLQSLQSIIADYR